MTELMWQRYPVNGMPGNITGNFGDDYGGYQHRGTDIGVLVGTPVYAPTDGVVVPMYNDGSFGIAVCLEHPGTGWYSLYAHLNQKMFGEGEFVPSGVVLGASGNTGYSSGPHLHWQVCDSPQFPTNIAHSRDPMLVPFGTPEPSPEDDMTPEERSLLLKVSSVVGGWTTGQEFVSVQEALTQFTTWEDRDQRILMGMDILNTSLNQTITILMQHMNWNHRRRTDLGRVLNELEHARASLIEIQTPVELSAPHEPGANEQNE